VQLPFGFVVHEEKCLILLYRAAQRSAELVQIELLPERRKIAPRIQRSVPEIFVERAVKLVRARLRRHQHRRTRTRAVFRRVVVSQDLEFLD